MLDSTAPNFTPWWTRADLATFDRNLARYRRALHFCRGRAADLRPTLAARIRFLEEWRATKWPQS